MQKKIDPSSLNGWVKSYNFAVGWKTKTESDFVPFFKLELQYNAWTLI